MTVAGVTLAGALLGVAVLLALGALAVALRAHRRVAALIYGGALALCAAIFAGALTNLLAAPPPETLVLPLGLPWLGAHFRLDPLASFF
ncbi:MAG TPA: hydrogenase 4 subunit B, partial [Rhodoblastus sp.]|nr:hydrogenase 4 subunit B [Rhodoblastus sp.]